MNNSDDPDVFDNFNEPNDPLAPRFDWHARYEAGLTPWDLGCEHPGLTEWLATSGADFTRGKVIVPGCGRGHDPLFLARSGFEVDAVDVVDLCANHFAAELKKLGGRFQVTNFLTFDASNIVSHHGPWNLLFEHTIFCAIDPSQRVAFGKAAAASVKPGGHLISFLFPVDKPIEEGGPPFRATPNELCTALGEAFELIDETSAPPGAPERRNWKERRLLFRRR